MCSSDLSGTTTETLPENLKLAWSRQLATPQPAWPEDPRIGFDLVPEPVVVGRTLYLASTRTDSVTAYDTRTGQLKWRVFADGPIRFAPLVADGKVVFGSDDGCVYAVDALDGHLLWLYDVTELLGGGRQQGYVFRHRGVTYEDGVVYSAAGSFMFALDAKTGQPCRGFGEAGEIDLSEGIGNRFPGEYGVTSPPLVLGDLVVTGTVVLDNIRADAPGHWK